jgi:ABC-2 type transport system ATP-binding protein
VAEIAGAGGMQLVVSNPPLAQEILAAAGVESQTVPARRSLEDMFIEMVGEDR